MGKYLGKHKGKNSDKIPSMASSKSCDHSGAYETSRHEVNGSTVIYMFCSCGQSISRYE